MNNATKSLDHIAPVFQVESLERALAYYREKLGFEVEFNHENIYASVVRDGCHIHLKYAPPASRDQAAFEKKEHLELRKQPYGTEFYVRDQDGYTLGFVQPAS